MTLLRKPRAGDMWRRYKKAPPGQISVYWWLVSEPVELVCATGWSADRRVKNGWEILL